jgi:hypothetical protein
VKRSSLSTSPQQQQTKLHRRLGVLPLLLILG